MNFNLDEVKQSLSDEFIAFNQAKTQQEKSKAYSNLELSFAKILIFKHTENERKFEIGNILINSLYADINNNDTRVLYNLFGQVISKISTGCYLDMVLNQGVSFFKTNASLSDKLKDDVPVNEDLVKSSENVLESLKKIFQLLLVKSFNHNFTSLSDVKNHLNIIKNDHTPETSYFYTGFTINEYDGKFVEFNY